VEYQREGFDMFKAMLDGIKEESVGFLFNLEVKTKEEQEAEARAQQEEAEAKALEAAKQGTARVLARQAAEQAAAAQAAANGSGSAPAGAAGTAPAGVSPTARRTGRGKGPVSQPAGTVPPVTQPAAASGTGPQLAVKGLDEPRPPAQLQYSAPSLDSSPKDSGQSKAAKSATVTGTKEPARNAPCPCGSGKKYKVCHGAPGKR
jgi:preprotein translocase subunit SecA